MANIRWGRTIALVVAAMVVLALVIGALFGLVAFSKSFNRSQKVKDARNTVKVTAI